MQSSIAALPIIGLMILFYFFFCYCLKLICEKAGVDAGILIYIPIVQLIPMFQAADINPLFILLLIIPIVNLVVTVWLWVRICDAIGKSPWLVIMLFIPILNIIFLPYLAFTD